MIQLISLEVHGFKNLEVNRLEFPPEGNILITGLNESGKSTLFEAIFFCLTGTILVKKGKTNADAIEFCKNDAVVKLTFQKGKVSAQITRSLHRIGTGATSNVTFKKNLDTPEEEVFDGKKVKEIDLNIQEFLGFDGDILLNSCFVAQKELDGFINTGKQKKMQIINKLLRLENFSKLKKKYDEERKELETLADYCSNEKLIAEFKEKMEKNTKNLKILQEMEESYSRHRELLKFLNSINPESVKAKIDGINERLRELEKNQEVLEKEKVNCTNFHNLVKLVKEKEGKLEVSNVKIQDLESQKKQIQDQIAEFDSIKTEIEKLKGEIDQQKAKIKDFEALNEIVKQVRAFQRDIDAQGKEREHEQNGLDSTRKDLISIELGIIKIIQDKVTQFQDQLKEYAAIEGTMTQSKETLQICEKAKEHLVKAQDTEKERKEIQIQVDSTTQKISEMQNQLVSATRSKNQLVENMELMAKKEDELKKITEEVKICEQNLSTLSEVEGKLKKKETEQGAAELFIWDSFSKKLQSLPTTQEGNLLRISLVGFLASIFLAIILGSTVNPALWGLLGVGAFFVILLWMVKKQLGPFAAGQVALKAILQEVKMHLSQSPGHPKKFLRAEILSPQTLIKSVESQVQELRVYLQQSAYSQPIEQNKKYYFKSMSDFSYVLWEELGRKSPEFSKSDFETASKALHDCELKRASLGIELKLISGQIAAAKEILIPGGKVSEMETEKIQLERALENLKDKCAQLQGVCDQEQKDYKLKIIDILPSGKKKQNLEEIMRTIQDQVVTQETRIETLRTALTIVHSQLNLEDSFDDYLNFSEKSVEESLSPFQTRLDARKKQIESPKYIIDIPATQNQAIYSIPEVKEQKKFLQTKLSEYQQQRDRFNNISQKMEGLEKEKQQTEKKVYIKYQNNLEQFDKDFSELSGNLLTTGEQLNGFQKRQKKINLDRLQTQLQTISGNLQSEQATSTNIHQEISDLKSKLLKEFPEIVKSKDKWPDPETIQENITGCREAQEAERTKLKSELQSLKTGVTQLNEKLPPNENLLDKKIPLELVDNKDFEKLDSFLEKIKESVLADIDGIKNHPAIQKETQKLKSVGKILELQEILKQMGDGLRENKGKYLEGINNCEAYLKSIENNPKTLRRVQKFKGSNRNENEEQSYSEILTRLDITKKALEIVTSAEGELVQRVLPRTMDYLVKILPILTADRYKDVDISEDYEVRVFDSKLGNYVSKTLFSGGTNDQIALGIRLAFAMATMRKGERESFIFLDEPLGFFDDERKNCLLDFLTRGEIADLFSQRFVISNYTQIKDHFDYIIEISNGRILDENYTGSRISMQYDETSGDEKPENLLEFSCTEMIEENGSCEYHFDFKNTSPWLITRIDFHPANNQNCDIRPRFIHHALKPGEARNFTVDFNRGNISNETIEIRAAITYQKENDEKQAVNTLQHQLEQK